MKKNQSDTFCYQSAWPSQSMSSGEFSQQCDSGLPTYRMLKCRNEQSGDHFYPPVGTLWELEFQQPK